MRKLTGLIGAFVVAGTAAIAQDDPIAARTSLMSANGAATALAGGMLKGELPYSPEAGKAAIASWQAVAISFGSFFPEGSADPSRSAAAPAIWEDRAGFDAELAKFAEAAAAASEAAGDDGPADQAAFAEVAQPVMQTCRSCHETYQLDD